jgi:hypothetical protein
MSESHWIPLAERLPPFREGGGDQPVLIFCPSLRADNTFPGHPCMVSNPEYVANGNAAKHHGATHWMPIPRYPEVDVE